MAFPGVDSRIWFVAAGVAAAWHSAAGFEPKDILSFQVGPVTLRPQLGVSAGYDSNIRFQSGNERIADFIGTIAPGLQLSAGNLEGNFLTLNYSMRSQFYWDHDELNAMSHLVNLQNRYATPAGRLTLSGSDSVQFLSSPLGGSLSFLDEPLVDRTLQNHRYRLSYRLSAKTGTYVEGAYDEVDYQSGIPIFDYNTVRLTGGFEYQPGTKLSFFSEAHWGQTAINPNHPSLRKGPHLGFIGGYVGAQGEFTPKIVGTVKAGYEGRQFSNGAPVSGGIVAGATLDYAATLHRTISLSYLRSSTVSVEASGETVTTDSVRARLEQIFGVADRWKATLTLAYSLYEYDIAKREDTVYTISTGLAYRMSQWLVTGVEYEFESFTNTLVRSSDYEVHRLVARMVIGY